VAAVWDRGQEVRVPVDKAVARKGPVVGPEQVTMAAHPLFPEWLLVSRGKHLVAAANLQKKNFSGFSEL
jgi:hypothetical protein